MRQDIDKQAKVGRYFFESITELGRWVDETPATWTYNSSKSARASQSWDLNCGYDGAVQLAKQGWREGAERASASLNAMVPVAYTRATVNDFYGMRPNVPRHCAGAPNAMIRRRREATHANRPVVSLVVPICANAGTEAEPMSNFGIGVARLIHTLEHAGTRCEVAATVALNVSGWRLCFAFRVKYADQPLDLSVLSYAIGHPAMFRRLCFALIERCPAKQDWGYGRQADTKPSDVLGLAKSAIILNGIDNANTVAVTPDAAVQYIGDMAREALTERKAA